MSDEITPREAHLGDLIADDRNANAGTDRGLDMLQRSLQNYGAGRSILLDRSGRIIAGNKTVEAAGIAGMEDVLIVPTDGTKIVAVQRTDLDLDDPRARELAIADNRVSEIGLDWDAQVLREFAEEQIEVLNFFREDELTKLFEELSQDDDDSPLSFGEGVKPPTSAGDGGRDGNAVEREKDGAAGGSAATPPSEFPAYDENIETQYCCPKCAYSWSGKPK